MPPLSPHPIINKMTIDDEEIINTIWLDNWYECYYNNCEMKHNGEHDENICNYVNR